MTERTLEIWHSPLRPNVEVAFGIALKAHVPYSESAVTLQVSPNIQEYRANADSDQARVRQAMVSTPTSETRALYFNLEAQDRYEVESDGVRLSIKLLRIERGKGGDPGTCFEFLVRKLE